MQGKSRTGTEGTAAAQPQSSRGSLKGLHVFQELAREPTVKQAPGAIWWTSFATAAHLIIFSPYGLLVYKQIAILKNN